MVKPREWLLCWYQIAVILGLWQLSNIMIWNETELCHNSNKNQPGRRGTSICFAVAQEVWLRAFEAGSLTMKNQTLWFPLSERHGNLDFCEHRGLGQWQLFPGKSSTVTQSTLIVVILRVVLMGRKLSERRLELTRTAYWHWDWMAVQCKLLWVPVFAHSVFCLHG